MRIHCDGCNQQILQDEAIVREVDGETYYFCSDECAAQERIVEPVLEQDDERDKERGR